MGTTEVDGMIGEPSEHPSVREHRRSALHGGASGERRHKFRTVSGLHAAGIPPAPATPFRENAMCGHVFWQGKEVDETSSFTSDFPGAAFWTAWWSADGVRQNSSLGGV
jgi:hypothetical protein